MAHQCNGRVIGVINKRFKREYFCTECNAFYSSFKFFCTNQLPDAPPWRWHKITTYRDPAELLHDIIPNSNLITELKNKKY